MPVYKKSEPKKVYLPSTKDEADEANRAWVMVKEKLTLGDVLDVSKLNDPEEQALIGALLFIVDWNYTDEDGEKLELNRETLREVIDPSDFKYIGELLTESVTASQIGLDTEEKKTLSGTSQTPTTVTTPKPASPLTI